MRKIDYSIRSFKVYKLTGDKSALSPDFIDGFDLLKRLTIHEIDNKIFICDVMGYIYFEYREDIKLLRMASDSIIHVFEKKHKLEHHDINILFKHIISDIKKGMNIERFSVIHGQYLPVKLPDNYVC